MTDLAHGACSAQQQKKRQADEQLLRERMDHIGQKLLVLSGKGGVGKSTVAANLAIALAAEGKRVGLLDVDVHGPSIPKLLGLEKAQVHGDGDQLVPVLNRDGIKVMSIGFLLPTKGDAVVWRGPRKYGLIKQFLLEVAWGDLDYLVIDAPPGTGDEPMAVAELAQPRAAGVVVTTPQALAIADVRRSVTFCHDVSLPVVGIVENMSGLVCPECGKRLDLFKSGGGEKLAKAMSVPFLGRIPIDPAIVNAGDDGTPFASIITEGETARAFETVVRAVMATTFETEVV